MMLLQLLSRIRTRFECSDPFLVRSNRSTKDIIDVCGGVNAYHTLALLGIFDEMFPDVILTQCLAMTDNEHVRFCARQRDIQPCPLSHETDVCATGTYGREENELLLATLKAIDRIDLQQARFDRTEQLGEGATKIADLLRVRRDDADLLSKDVRSGTLVACERIRPSSA